MGLLSLPVTSSFNPFPQPSSGQDGWAHYAEQMMLDQGFRADDPTYGGYFLGKLAMLKLRADVHAARGAAFDLRQFHEQVMSNGIAPLWAHRQLLLPGDTSPVLH